MIIRHVCLGVAVIGLIASASGGCSSDSTPASSSSGGTDGGSSGTSSSSGSSGASSGSSGTSSGSSGTSSGSSGTSSGSSGTSSGSSGDAGNDAGPTVDPAVYCTKLLAACTGANAQYVEASAAADCAKAAAYFAKGAYADATNDVGCRQYHADLATTAGPATHCPHAGMFGGAAVVPGTCGERCDDFCTVATQACAQADTGYADKAACVTACANWQVDTNKAIGPKWVGEGAGGINGVATEGYNCRSYHLSVALSTPDPHCKHIGATSPTCK